MNTLQAVKAERVVIFILTLAAAEVTNLILGLSIDAFGVAAIVFTLDLAATLFGYGFGIGAARARLGITEDYGIRYQKSQGGAASE